MFELLVGTVCVLAIATAAAVLGYWYQCYQFDQWMSEMNAKGVKTALEPVLSGSDIVGYTLVKERRCRAR